MSPDTLRTIGRLLFVPPIGTPAGEPQRDSHWQTPMAAALGVSRRYIGMVLRGDRPMPGDWPDKVRAIARRRVAETMRAHELACGESG